MLGPIWFQNKSAQNLLKYVTFAMSIGTLIY